MNIIYKKKLVYPKIRQWLLCLIFTMAFLFSMQVNASPSYTSKATLPQVVMLEIQGITPNDKALYKAILAQLSAAPMILNTVQVNEDSAYEKDPLNIASKLLYQNQASMVFWIKEESLFCSLFFHSSKTGTDDIETHSRILNLEAQNRSSRLEVIANAVASVVEGFLITKTVTLPPDEDQETPFLVPQTSRPRLHGQLKAGYSSTLFYNNFLAHGISVGAGITPLKHLALNLSYTHHLDLKQETSDYVLTLVPRYLKASVSARIPLKTFEFSSGLAWSVDLRSYSTRSLNEDIFPRQPKLEPIYSVTAFLSTMWFFLDWLGLEACLGANFGINEKAYKILRSDDSTTTVFKPHLFKFTYNVGLVIRF